MPENCGAALFYIHKQINFGMKRTYFFIAATALCMPAFAQQAYTVNARVEGQGAYKLTLGYNGAGGRVMDSLQRLTDDQFRITGSVEEPVVAYLFSSHPSAKHEIVKGGMFMPAPALEFVLEQGQINITGNAAEGYMATVKGGKLNSELSKLKAEENLLVKKTWELRKQSTAVNRTDTVAQRALREKIAAAGQERLQLHKNYISAHPASFISMYLLSQLYADYTAEAYEQAFAKMAPAYKNSRYGKIVAGKIESAKATALGQKAINFTKKDINGKDFSLTSLQGKYVLLDFWGSWCGPCRQSHPHLKAVYEKYKSKGLEIVGISEEKMSSLAQSETAWKKAVKDDGIEWLHVLNNYGKENFDLVQKYGVTGFPTKFLLDKEGRILYKIVGAGDEGDKAVDEKLKEVFGE